MIVLFGGAAGSGKTTIARLWCEARTSSVHIQLDEIREMIIAGRADPQIKTTEQEVQYNQSVVACTALARSFADSGYDVAIDDVFEPQPTRELWLPQLRGLDIRLVILYPPLEVALSRMANREKYVSGHIIRSQYSAMSEWPLTCRINNEGLTPVQTLERIESILESAVFE